MSLWYGIQFSQPIKEHKNLGANFHLKEHVLVAHTLKHTVRICMKLYETSCTQIQRKI